MGLSVAFDLATHQGDSDHRVVGDVGKATSPSTPSRT
jgi:methylmalonyl-CoA mutase N-terminal domain/subunit